MSTSILKRKRDDFDDSDDDDVLYGRQALPVANLPEDFSGEPEDGMQYLFTVRRDARQLPHVTRVPNPYELPEPSSGAPITPVLTNIHPALPSLEWRKQYVTRFRNFRKNSSQPTIHVSAIPSIKLMPDKKERDHWWAFLTGKPESDWNPPKKPKQNRKKYGQGMHAFADDPTASFEVPPPDKSEEPHQEIASKETWRINEDGEVELAQLLDYSDSQPPALTTPQPEIQTETVLKGREPTPTLLQQIDERMALHLLMYFAHWINLFLEEPETSSMIPTECHARWIFALLARVEDHISADDTSHLRSLARACISIIKIRLQSTLSIDGTPPLHMRKIMMSDTSCWMIITTIIELWAQRDLWTDAEVMLKSVATALP